jgi:hypothetical protein
MRADQLDEEDYVLQEIDGETIGKYSEAEIASDKEEAQARIHSFEQKEKLQFKKQGEEAEKNIRDRMKVGEYYEAYFYENAGGPDGIFPNSRIYKTGVVDDQNGIDFAVETSDEEFLGIATDVTMVSNVNDLMNKLSRIKKDIDRGVFAEIKYFQTKDGGTLKVPRAIVAAEFESVVRSLKLWAQNEKDHSLTNGMKIKALLEIELEFQAGMEYAQAIGQKVYERVYTRALKNIGIIKSEHAEDIKRYKTKIEDDQSYQVVFSWADQLKREAAKIRDQKLAA